MIKVAGLWELNWNNPLSESWMWSFVLREFGVKDWAMTPVTGIIHNEKWTGMALNEYHNIDDLLHNESGDDVVRVYVDENGTTELSEFQHPENVLYIFGNAGTRPMVSRFRDGDVSLRIDTPGHSGVLWPHQVLLTVLYDRYKKHGY